MLTTTTLLPLGLYAAGTYNLGPATLPLGVSAITLRIDRTTWNNPAFKITASLEFSPDGGVTWFPWGSFGATGEALIRGGLPVTESNQTVSFIHRVAGDGFGLMNPFTSKVPYIQTPGTIEPGWEPTNPNRMVRGTVVTTAAITTAVLMTLDDAAVPLTLPAIQPHQSVSTADITVGQAQASAAVTITTPSFTVTSNANRGGLLGLSLSSNGVTAITGSIGGVSGSAISGTDSGSTVTVRSLQFQVIAPPAGAQTGTVSWTTSADVILGALTTSGVDQTTPCNNGTFATGAASPSSVAITSTNGDLTIDTEVDDGGFFPASPTQTNQWSRRISSIMSGAGSTGPGTGTTTHQWTITPTTAWAVSGSNFVAAIGGGAADPYPDRVLLTQNADTRLRMKSARCKYASKRFTFLSSRTVARVVAHSRHSCPSRASARCGED